MDIYWWFSISILDRYIDEYYLKRVSYSNIKARGKWKKEYTEVRLAYCIDKYIELYGIESYRSIAIKFIAELEVEEKKAMARIQELMNQFIKVE